MRNTADAGRGAPVHGGGRRPGSSRRTVRRPGSGRGLYDRGGNRRRVSRTCTLATPCTVNGQELEIGIIDLYGLSRVPARQVRATLTFTEGDTIAFGNREEPAFLTESEERLARSPDIARARIRSVCCDRGRAIVFVGIEKRGAATMRFHAEPEGDARLAADTVRAGDEGENALRLAILRGDAGEDRSRGHSLVDDPATRAIQERFVLYAARDLPELRRVLRSSSDAAHRALAAQVLGYAADKPAVVDDLVNGMSDPSAAVRNNASRALGVFAEMLPGTGLPVPRVPAQPFIELLDSPVWSDRNKASGALAALSTGRDPELLARLREQALAPLIEMARWKSEGHALSAFFILGRIAGYSDEAAYDLWQRGDRDAVIDAARSRP